MPPFILNHISLNIWKFSGTQTSKNFKMYGISLKDLILDRQAEILDVTPIDWTAPSWARSSLPHDQVSTWTNARVRVFSDSVICLVKVSDHSKANRRWENEVDEFRKSNSYRDILGIDGDPIEFEWNIFHGRTSLEILQTIQEDLQERNIEPEKFEDRIVFTSMFNDIEWTKRRNAENNVFQFPKTS